MRPSKGWQEFARNREWYPDVKQIHLCSLLLKCAPKEQSYVCFLPDRIWRRIVGESKYICGTISSKVKVKLQCGFLGQLWRMWTALPQGHCDWLYLGTSFASSQYLCRSTAHKIVCVASWHTLGEAGAKLRDRCKISHLFYFCTLCFAVAHR